MASVSSTSIAGEPTTPFDHITFMGYTHVMCAFASESPDVPSLRTALAQVLERAPFVAGTVQSIPEAGSNTPSGWHHVAAPYDGVDEVFTVHDLRDTPQSLDYAAWKTRGCPVSEVVGFCARPPTLVPPPAPVTRIRLTIVSGGCFLSTSIHHAAIDGAGLARVVQAWAAACRGEHVDLSRAEIKKHHAYILAPAVPFPAQPLEATAQFAFPAAALAKLKARASENLPAGSWISTHDAVTALLWTRISRAIGRDAGVNVATNARARFSPPLPETYAGNAVYFARAGPIEAHRQPNTDLDIPLSTAALAVREAVQAIKSEHLASIAQLVSRHTPLLEAHAAPDGPVAVSSWVSQGFHSFDWGESTFPGLKAPQCDRVLAPKWIRPRLCLILPQRPGYMDVVVGLQQSHMDKLLQDKLFLEFATLNSLASPS
ncbi:transferase family-domain-containing protein [Auriculariales sp. MPI-PUGE-AT-0066]|nr:transferase family-domain-containing protein [Auriculariales sp. MPI-PUGE-AT-0066]